jgi:hypothetical protein
MATRSFGFDPDFLSKGAIETLVLLTLAVGSSFGVTGAQSAGSATALPPNAPAIPATIKNAPFSAQVISEYDHVLAKGNRIHRETHGRIFRDSHGRVRTETQVAGLSGVGSLDHIMIRDPVLNEIIHLDARTRTASIHQLGDPPATPAETSHANVPGKSGKALLSTPQTSATIAVAAPHPESGSNAATESLGVRMIEGLIASGTRTTRSLENAQGDRIIAVNEVWYSRDLQMIILSTSEDGQSGRTVMRLTNIVRGAPSEKLFQVPPDYTVKDGIPISAVIKP